MHSGRTARKPDRGPPFRGGRRTAAAAFLLPTNLQQVPCGHKGFLAEGSGREGRQPGGAPCRPFCGGGTVGAQDLVARTASGRYIGQQGSVPSRSALRRLRHSRAHRDRAHGSPQAGEGCSAAEPWGMGPDAFWRVWRRACDPEHGGLGCKLAHFQHVPFAKMTSTPQRPTLGSRQR